MTFVNWNELDSRTLFEIYIWFNLQFYDVHPKKGSKWFDVVIIFQSNQEKYM